MSPRDTAENGFCKVSCGSVRSLRDECVQNPCLALDQLCRAPPKNTTAEHDESCADWCCPMDAYKVAGVAFGFFLLLLCVCSICCYCHRRRMRRAKSEAVRSELAAAQAGAAPAAAAAAAASQHAALYAYLYRGHATQQHHLQQQQQQQQHPQYAAQHTRTFSHTAGLYAESAPAVVAGVATRIETPQDAHSGSLEFSVAQTPIDTSVAVGNGGGEQGSAPVTPHLDLSPNAYGSNAKLYPGDAPQPKRFRPMA